MAQLSCQDDQLRCCATATTPAQGLHDDPLDCQSHVQPSSDFQDQIVLEENSNLSSSVERLEIPKRPLLCRNVMSRDNIWHSLDGHVQNAISDSEPDFVSDSEAWSDDGEDESDESVLCLTSTGAQPLDTSHSLRPPLPRRLSFKPLEEVEEEPAKPKQTERYLGADILPTPEPEQSPHILIAAATPGEMFHNEYFTISRTESAGWGAFAAKDLKYGDKILFEKPLFIADWRTLFEEYENLDPKQKQIAMSLHANELTKSGTPKLQAVWATNCFAVAKGGVAGLFPIAARFNHACRPRDSIGYSYNTEHECLEMVVQTDHIPAGTELTISYGDRTPRDLYLAYGFRCKCGACPGLSDREVHKINFQWW